VEVETHTGLHPRRNTMSDDQNWSDPPADPGGEDTTSDATGGTTGDTGGAVDDTSSDTTSGGPGGGGDDAATDDTTSGGPGGGGDDATTTGDTGDTSTDDDAHEVEPTVDLSQATVGQLPQDALAYNDFDTSWVTDEGVA
jgi:hypothetical protein